MRISHTFEKLPPPPSRHPTYAVLAFVFALLAYALLPGHGRELVPAGASSSLRL